MRDRKKILVTGAAGNLGSRLALHLLRAGHSVNLMVHKTSLPFDSSTYENASVFASDLADKKTLHDACDRVDSIVHLAGVLFRPFPGRFLHKTNVLFVENLVDVALECGVRKFILISFPHVEGETTPQAPATGRMDGKPKSLHARTRLEAEKYLFDRAQATRLRPISLRSGTVYGKGILMIEAARWLMKHRLFAVWRRPTWTHLISIDDFLGCVESAIFSDHASGVYCLCDEKPLYLQDFVDMLAHHWGCPKPVRLPFPLFLTAAALSEVAAFLLRTPCPIHRDFIRIGASSHVCDTTRMRSELLSELKFPTVEDGMSIL